MPKITRADFLESLIRSLRTFVPAFLVLFVPGLLGWLHAVTQWANSHGATPFPDAKGLGYLAVSATVAGLISLTNLAINLVEDWTGVKIGRSRKE